MADEWIYRKLGAYGIFDDVGLGLAAETTVWADGVVDGGAFVAPMGKGVWAAWTLGVVQIWAAR